MRHWILAVIATCAGLGSSAAETTFRIPRLSQAPVIDGQFQDTEWQGALAVGAFQTLRQTGTPRTLQEVRLGWDADRLYLAFRTHGEDPSTLVATSAGRDGSLWQDDAFELHVSPAQGDQKVQFIGNSAGILFDARDGDTSWNADCEYAATPTADGWSAELAVRWRDLGLGDPETSPNWRMLVCHDDADSRLAAQASAWTPVRTSFHDQSSYAAVRLVEQDTFGAVTDVARVDDAPAPQLRLNSARQTPVTLHCALDVAEETVLHRTVTINPGVPQEVSFEFPEPLPERTRGVMRVTDEDGVAVLTQALALGVRRRVTVSFRDLLVIGRCGFEVMGPPGSTGTVAYRLRDERGRIVKQGRQRLTNGRGELSVEVPQRHPVKYDVNLSVTIPEADIRETFAWNASVPEPPEWLGTDAGMREGVLPPYTPLEVRGERLECWGRVYDFEGSWLPQQIVSAHEELLQSPMRLLARVGGREVDLGALPLAVTSHSQNRIETRAAGTVAGIGVEATAWMEEDGFWWCTVTLTPAGQDALDAMVLEMPVRRDIARYIHPSDSTWATTSGTLAEAGWRSHFWPVVSLVNDDKGVAWYCESAAGWRPADQDAVLRVDVTEDVATLRCDLLGSRTELGEGRTYSFGVQACPVKPIPADWRSRRIVHGAHYGMGSSARYEVGSLTYPAEGNIDFRAGTFEAWVKPLFDPNVELRTREGRGIHNNSFLQVGPEGDYYTNLYWNIDDRGWRFLCHNPPVYDFMLSAEEKVPWQQGEWRHVALTWGDAVRIYDNGRLVAEEPAEGLWAGRTPGLGDLQVRLGSLHVGVSRFEVRDVRISSRPLEPAAMLLDAKAPRRTADTLLYDPLTGLSPGTGATAAGGRLLGGAHVESGEDGATARLFAEDGQSEVEQLAELGCRTLVYHQRWTPDYGKPYTVVNAERLDRLVQACHGAGIKLLLYVGYGLGDLAPETAVYHDVWTSLPIIRWVSRDGDKRQAFSRSCTASQHWTDFMLHNLRDTLRRHGADGFYYDGTIGFRSCMNQAHGCSYIDEGGIRRPTYPILATRRYAKRLYSIAREHRVGNLIDCHTSANVLPMRAAWVDQLWNGEQFQSHRPGFHFPMDYFRSQCIGTQYGVPSMFLTYHQRPFEEKEALSFTLLHDVLPRSRSPRIVRLWQIQDRFDVAAARWLPYWDNVEYLSVTSDPPGEVWDEAGLASLHLHHGKRALLTVSNIQDEPATVSVRLYPERLGLTGEMRARDAEEDTAVPIEDKRITVELQGYDYRLIWLE